MQKTSIAIAGSGMVGLVAALTAAKRGFIVSIVSPSFTNKDPRTTAFLMGSVEICEDIGIWNDLVDKSHPLKTMRLIDASERLIRSPQIDFSASEIDLDAFGYNFKNEDVLSTFLNALRAMDNVTFIEARVVGAQQVDERISLQAETAANETLEINADYVLAADGRNSIVRESLLPGTTKTDHGQKALVVDFTHKCPTHFTSTEFHGAYGPFTIVPQSSSRAGLVWMDKTETIDAALSMANEPLETLLEEKMGSYLGKLTLETKPASFVISSTTANSFGKGRCMLLGEAAHVIPPIGAQGFNLGLRDAKTAIDLICTANNPEIIGEEYDAQRSHDIRSTTTGVNLLNQSLMTSFLPAQAMRSLGIQALKRIEPLRKLVMKRGISPTAAA